MDGLFIGLGIAFAGYCLGLGIEGAGINLAKAFKAYIDALKAQEKMDG